MVSDNLQWKINVIEAQLDENEPRLYKSKFAAQKEAKREANPEELRKQLVDLKQTLGNRKIHHGRKILQKAIKQALKIESLKLSKRIKKNPEKEKKLAKEKEALDQLTDVDLGELMAAKLIQKTFLRTQKSLQNPPPFISGSTIEWTLAKQKELVSLLNSAEAQNVYGRLGKVEGVRKASNDLLSSLNSVNKNVKRDEPKADGKLGGNEKSGSADKKETKEMEPKGDESESDSDDDESNDNEDDDDDEQTSEAEGTEKSVNGSKKRKSSSQDDDDNDNEDDSDDESGDSESENPDPFFLPTLATGYISGSDDEDDIDANDSVVRQATSTRKNRRGQRARQKIWEQKYGRRAKHIVKQKQENYEKQKAKQERQERREQKRLKMEEDRKQQQQQKAKEFDSKPLHPSWQAKKKVSAPVKFEGKKMKFD